MKAAGTGSRGAANLQRDMAGGDFCQSLGDVTVCQMFDSII